MKNKPSEPPKLKVSPDQIGVLVQSFIDTVELPVRMLPMPHSHKNLLDAIEVVDEIKRVLAGFMTLSAKEMDIIRFNGHNLMNGLSIEEIHTAHKTRKK